jgi:hypothetical protein
MLRFFGLCWLRLAKELRGVTGTNLDPLIEIRMFFSLI